MEGQQLPLGLWLLLAAIGIAKAVASWLWEHPSVLALLLFAWFVNAAINRLADSIEELKETVEEMKQAIDDKALDEP